MNLKSLEEFNAEAFAKYGIDHRTPRPNGIACPKCGQELFDTSPMMTLTSHPPQKDVHCAGCGYKGYRVAG